MKKRFKFAAAQAAQKFTPAAFNLETSFAAAQAAQK